MIYQIADIKKAVRVCLDENMTSDALFADEDEETLSLDAVIESKILEAVEAVHKRAPYYMVEQGHNLSDGDIAITWGTGDFEGTGYLYLPEDFMRLVVFEMSDWERAVYEAIEVGSALYAKQRSRIKGIRGTPQRPVCAIGVRPEGKVLEFYSSKNNRATVNMAAYIPYPTIDEYGGVDISERCYTAVIYSIAGMTLITCGETEQGASLIGESNRQIER